MKELSIEQKAQRYDETIEKLRSLRDNYDTVSTLIDIKEELENIFPELKESEDERISREITEFLVDFNNGEYERPNENTIDSWLSWLEKQDKTSPILSNSSNIGKVEQKPAWSVEDEDILNTIINHFKIDIECTDEDDMVRWLKSLKDRVQPKQEWSEEDETTRKALINLVEMYYGGCIDKTEKNRLLNFLKSIIPQTTWKPSDVQIGALIIAQESLSYENDHKSAKIIKDLLEQLEKLREE